jgi:hypothetical protein
MSKPIQTEMHRHEEVGTKMDSVVAAAKQTLMMHFDDLHKPSMYDHRCRVGRQTLFGDKTQAPDMIQFV